MAYNGTSYQNEWWLGVALFMDPPYVFSRILPDPPWNQVVASSRPKCRLLPGEGYALAAQFPRKTRKARHNGVGYRLVPGVSKAWRGTPKIDVEVGQILENHGRIMEQIMENSWKIMEKSWKAMDQCIHSWETQESGLNQPLFGG